MNKFNDNLILLLMVFFISRQFMRNSAIESYRRWRYFPDKISRELKNCLQFLYNFDELRI